MSKKKKRKPESENNSPISFCVGKFFSDKKRLTKFHGRLINLGIKEKEDRDDILQEIALLLLSDRFTYYSDRHTEGMVFRTIRWRAFSLLTFQSKVRRMSAKFNDQEKIIEFCEERVEQSEPKSIRRATIIPLEYLIIGESLLFAGMNPDRFLNNPNCKKARSYGLKQFARLEAKLDSGKINHNDLLKHLASEFPDLDIDDQLGE